MSQNLQNLAKFQKFQLDNLLDFEKCCKTHIYLQKSASIQPRMSRSKFADTYTLPRSSVPLFTGACAGAGTCAQASPLDCRCLHAFHARGPACPRGALTGRGDVREHWLAKFRQNVARFRLYRLRFFQVNMRFAAFFKIYQILKLKFLKFDKILQILRHLQCFC